ncbi:MAG: hypothetical protein C0622_12795 [Desulfuromonas sp.]|nr:MAG: hypothetical protein C0622_12795 [Desulfuromonas sp.]
MPFLHYIYNTRGLLFLVVARLLVGLLKSSADFTRSDLHLFLFLAGFQDLFFRTARMILSTAADDVAGGQEFTGNIISSIILNPRETLTAWIYPHCGGYLFMVPIWAGCAAVALMERTNVF